MLFSVIFLLLMLIFHTDTGKIFVVICAVIGMFGLELCDWNLLQLTKVEGGLLFCEKIRTKQMFSCATNLLTTQWNFQLKLLAVSNWSKQVLSSSLLTTKKYIVSGPLCDCIFEFTQDFFFHGRTFLLLCVCVYVVQNKRILLRERKRHTACHVASGRYAAVSPGGGEGTPIQSWAGGGTPIQSWIGGAPCSSGWEVPHPVLSWMGVPPSGLDARVPLCPDMLRGYSPVSKMGSPPPASVDRLKILPSLILRMWAVMI